MPHSIPARPANLGRAHPMRILPLALRSLVVALACLGLSACGNSSATHHSSAAVAAATTTAPAAPPTTTATTTGKATTTTTTTTTPPSGGSTQETPAFKHARAEIIEVVDCARRHGIQLPEPDASNNVSTSGFDTKSKRYQTVVGACYHQALKKNGQVAEAGK